MRITNGMIAANTLRNINKAANRLASANAAVSSNQKIQLASDDPVVAARAVTYRSYVSQIKQYQDNNKAASGWQSATDDALSQLSDLITTVKTLTTEASSDTCSAEDLSDIKERIEELQKEAVSIMNTTYAGRYIFGGYSTSQAPYEITTTGIGDTAIFKGDYLSLGGVVSSEISDADILSFYNNNSSSLSGSLSNAVADALSAYNVAKAASDADPTNSTLLTKTAAAKSISDALASAVTTYGGSTNLTTAASKSKNQYDVLTDAIGTYIGSTTLTDSISSALTAYNTAQAAADADSTDTSLAEAAKAAKNTYDTLVDLSNTYTGTDSLDTVASSVKTMSDALAQVVSNSEENIKYNIGFSKQVTVNIEGQDVTGQGADNLLDTFAKLLLALDGDSSYKSVELDSLGNPTVEKNSLSLTDLIDEFSADLDRVTVAQATLGARMDNVDKTSNSLADAYTAYSTLMSNNEDIDTAQVATELTSAEYTYEASLSVGAKAISKTLIDYLS